MLMVDLCSGLGGASKPFKERGWEVITVDINPEFEPDVLGDVTKFESGGLAQLYRRAMPSNQYPDRHVDLFWASPPCTEYTKFSMPWYPNAPIPDLSIFKACEMIIQDFNPTYWVIENVRGARPFFGKPTKRTGPYYLWGNFPIFDTNKIQRFKWKMGPRKDRPALRAQIPYELGLNLCLAIERELDISSSN